MSHFVDSLRMTRLKLLAVLVTSAALAPAALVAAPSASADSSGCDYFHNVCIHASGGAGGTVTIAGSPYGSDFTGTFTVTGPGGYSATSPDQTWTTNDTWPAVISNAAGGEYCVSGYSDDGNNQGMACESIS
jgi:hypothetical protein